MISGPANKKQCNNFYSEWYPDFELHRQHEQTKHCDTEDRSASDTVISSAGNVRLCEKRDGLKMTTWYLVKKLQKVCTTRCSATRTERVPYSRRF